MPSVIQSNDIQAKLPKSFFFFTIARNKWLRYRRNDSFLSDIPSPLFCVRVPVLADLLLVRRSR